MLRRGGRMKQVLNAYIDTQTGRKFKVWETEQQYENRNSMRYTQISHTEVEE